MPTRSLNIPGLTNEQVIESAKKYGTNRVNYRKENGLLKAITSLIKEPMILLLLITSSIYFISGNLHDGIFLLAAIAIVAAISLYQDTRSRNALEQLRTFTAPTSKVIRNGQVTAIKSEELVTGDYLLAEEGTAIPADGTIVEAHDLSVNESILTGESMPVFKNETSEEATVFKGTTVASGMAIVTVTSIGSETRLAKIGKSLEDIEEERTPLEIQINSFVKKMVMTGVIVFIIVWVINYLRSFNALDSLLKALTLAMSILPEEIPVAFTTFMALGAWRLMKKGIVVKQMKTVETLGSATVICTDKTGTLTENKMSLAALYELSTGKIANYGDALSDKEKYLIRLAMWASEPIPFDPMEKALHEAYAKIMTKDERNAFKMIHEYPLDGKPPMMTHLFADDQGHRIIAAKGAPEALMLVSDLSEQEKQRVEAAIIKLAENGYRVLGVGESSFTGDQFPATQQEFKFSFKGIVAFYDPPKDNIRLVLESFYAAGIKVKIITGDNTATTSAIARQIGFKGYEQTITGEELMQLSEEALLKEVSETNVFTRMFPEAKLKIINALKTAGEIVAMTGDGVNDAPALKAAHIGIAMGKKGTEIAKQAASLVLQEDDLSEMVNAVATGRKIYTNLKKAIRYIISIHIPIILTVFIPLALGWIYPNIFSPVHIIFMELIMGPTCSIIYENEPMEQDTMNRPPRPFTSTFFNWHELAISIVQGLIITAGTLITYRYAIQQGYNEAVVRTMVFTVLVVANIFLTLVNRSFYYSMLTTIRYKNNAVLFIIGIAMALMGLLLLVPPLTSFFRFETLNRDQLLFSSFTGFISVVWFEALKWMRRTGLTLNKTGSKTKRDHLEKRASGNKP